MMENQKTFFFKINWTNRTYSHLLIPLALLATLLSACNKDDEQEVNNRSASGTYYANIQFNGINYNMNQNSFASPNGSLLCQRTIDIFGRDIWGITAGSVNGISPNSNWTLGIGLGSISPGSYFTDPNVSDINYALFTPTNSNGLSYTTVQGTTWPLVEITITESNSTFVKGTFAGELSPNIIGNTDIYPFSGSFKVPIIQ